MGTNGNLELRLIHDTLQASTTHDGINVYETTDRLAKFLDSIKNPTNDQYKNWFIETSKDLQVNEFRGEHLGGITTNEIIIDVPRKLILYTHNYEYPDSFMNACIKLQLRHNYQILQYGKPIKKNPYAEI